MKNKYPIATFSNIKGFLVIDSNDETFYIDKEDLTNFYLPWVKELMERINLLEEKLEKKLSSDNKTKMWENL